MKSFLLGCGVVALIIIALGVAGIFFLRSFGMRMGNEIQGGQRALLATNQEFPFQAPGDGKLAEDRLLVWCKIREQSLAQETTLTAQFKRGGFRAVKTMMGMMPEIYKEYEAVLREQKMSLNEYVWITGQIRGALKSRAAAKDPQMTGMVELVDRPSPMMQGGGGPQPQFSPGQAPAVAAAPLDSEDARPVLALLKKHEAEFRKAAPTPFGEMFLGGLEPSPRARPSAGGEKPTSHTALLATSHTAPLAAAR